MFSRILQWFGRLLATYLTRQVHIHRATLPPTASQLLSALQTGDVLLVEGDSRISGAIKYLTQSSWSHAALYVGEQTIAGVRHAATFIEADIKDGVRCVSVDEFRGLNARICRPIGLSPEDCQRVAEYAIGRIGQQYDLRNVIDLARYLIPNPPVTQQQRRQMLVLGSGDPTRAICSTLVAQAFQSIRYPILPRIDQAAHTEQCPDCIEEILTIRHHSLFVPRDFDLSPYFEVIKPSLPQSFDYHSLQWR